MLFTDSALYDLIIAPVLAAAFFALHTRPIVYRIRLVRLDYRTRLGCSVSHSPHAVYRLRLVRLDYRTLLGCRVFCVSLAPLSLSCLTPRTHLA